VQKPNSHRSQFACRVRVPKQAQGRRHKIRYFHKIIIYYVMYRIKYMYKILHVFHVSLLYHIYYCILVYVIAVINGDENYGIFTNRKKNAGRI